MLINPNLLYTNNTLNLIYHFQHKFTLTREYLFCCAMLRLGERIGIVSLECLVKHKSIKQNSANM